MKREFPLLLILFLCLGFTSVFSQSVTSFTLINADTDQPIKTLQNGDIIDYAAIGTNNLNIVANTSPAKVGSVGFNLDGISKTENIAPYAFAGDNISGATTNYNAINPDLAPGLHTVQATAYSGSNKSGTKGATLSVTFTITNGISANLSPSVNAGPDKTLTLPANSTTLNGSASDIDGTFVSVLWTKVSGPSATMAGQATNDLSLSGLVQGTYVFNFKATDDDGASSSDNVTVNVNSGATTSGPQVVSFTLINADTDQDIQTLNNEAVLDYSTLPTRNLNIRANTNPATVGSVVFTLDGKNKNENGAPYTLAGDVTSGGKSNYNKLVPELAAGSHTLSAKAFTSANGGGTASAPHTVSFTVVDNSTPSNQSPTANAGPDKSLTLPANSTTLNGSGTDSDGSISSYSWVKISGPSASLSGANTATLSVSNMVEGTYIFRLTVTDNLGAPDTDDATVVVSSGTTGGGGGACATYNEQNGLVVIEIESTPTAGDWSKRTAVAGYTGTGYYEWRHGNNTTSAIGSGQGILTYSIKINSPGRYRFQLRSAAPERTDYNDVFVKFPEGNAFAVKGTTNNSLSSNWFKVYHNVSNNTWTWETKTTDHNPHDIYVDFPAAGVYKVQFSGRSNLFKIDRFVLYKSTAANPTSTGNSQSACAGSSKTDDVMTATDKEHQLSAYPNPSSGNITFEFSAANAGEILVDLYDVNGKLIKNLHKGNLEAGEIQMIHFNGNELPKGLYLARLVTADKVLVKQIMLQ